MRVYAIVMLVIFYVIKIAVYGREYMSKRGYVSDYGHTLTMILPIISMLMYGGCVYMLYDTPIGFVVNNILSWLVLVISMVVVHHMPFASCYIKSDDNNDCYNVASGVIRYLKRIDKDIVYDDNIGMSTSIKIAYNRKKFSRNEMDLLIGEQYVKNGAKKKLNRISLLFTMVHAVELIFDISFFVSITMM